MIQQAIAQRRPGDLLRAEAAATGTRPRSTTTATPGPAVHARRVRRAQGSDVTLARLRPDGEDLPGGRRGRGRARARRSRSIDLRSLSPLDLDTVAASVRRTGRLVVVHEAPTFLGARRRGRRAGHRASASTHLRRRCCGSAASTRPYPPSPARGGLPARPRPGARRRRPRARLLSERPTDERAAVQAARRRRGPDRGRDRDLEGQGRATPSRSTRSSSRSRPRSRWSSCPSPYAGVVAELLVAEGETVEVGTPIIAVDTGAGGALRPTAAASADAGADRRTRRRARPSVADARPSGAVEPGLIGGHGHRAAGRRCSSATAPRTTEAERAAAQQGAARRSEHDVVRPPASTVPAGTAEADGRSDPIGRRRRVAAGRWPSRRCASWPRTSASTWPPSPRPGPGGVGHPRGRAGGSPTGARRRRRRGRGTARRGRPATRRDPRCRSRACAR